MTSNRSPRIWLFLTGLFLTGLLGSSWASADTFNINSFVDSIDANPGDGVCADSLGRCTLRAAIIEANFLPGPDTIYAPPGIYNMTLSGADEDDGLTGDMDIYDDVSIIGLGTTRIESAVGRIIHVHDGDVSITGLTLTAGDANNDAASGKKGGAVHNALGSTLTLNNCTVTVNTAQGGGGGIYNLGTLTLNGSTMNTNSAPGTSKGGAIFNAGMMTITNSTLSGNSATGAGGGIFSENGSTLVMNNVTIASNQTTAGSNGGGINIEAGADATLSNTILANNTAAGSGPDCSGTITSLGGNLIQVTTGCTVVGGGVINGNPNLGPLQDNGGRTFTRALPSGSPAVDAGNDPLCEATDQRGLARPQGVGGCDIGAYERFPNCPAITINPTTLPAGDPGVYYTQTITPSGGVAPYTFSITAGSLPPGLALNSDTGVISGVPTTVGFSTFTVTAFDANFCPGSRTYTNVKIGEPCNNVTITISPTTLPAGAQGQSYSQQLTATGGTAPYQYTITEGSLPPGLTLSLSTGLISGSPSSTGTFFFEVTATDANICTGSQSYVLTIPCTLDVQPATLPNGTEGVAYSQTLTGSGGTAPYTFAVASGALPPGLSLTGAGELSGTPTTPGTYTFVIEATDDNNCTGARGYTVVIDSCLVVSPDTLPNGIVGTPYSQTVSATGGTGTITFAVSSGSLPNQLGLNQNTGVISGTPNTGGISLFTIKATDSSTPACTTSKDYYIVVNPVGCPAITISPTTLPNGDVGQNYNRSLTASGGSGGYVFTLLTGDLPSGLSLSGGGTVSGNPGQSGIFTFTVAATDSNGCTGTQTITLSIFPTGGCPLIVLFPSPLPDGQPGVPYSQTITPTGGAAPYTYTVETGSLPTGLTLNSSTGVISGTPTAIGSFSFTIKATDTTLCFGTESYTLDITATLSPTAITLVSDATGVWEPGETVTIAPSWTNNSAVDFNAVTGTLSEVDATISLTDTSASYGNILAGATASCTGNPYSATSIAGPRPATHWDALATELLSTSDSHAWPLHIGLSFSDVPTSNVFYRQIETMLHKGVTAGCTQTTYCPTSSTTRGQMAVFIVRALTGGDANVAVSGTFGACPFNCTSGGASCFTDVAPTDFFCKHVHYMAVNNITTGCGGTLFCPSSDVTRAQMAIFIARGAAGGDANVPISYSDPGTGRSYNCSDNLANNFVDVPDSLPYCRHAHYLWARGFIEGCAVSPPAYCPNNLVTRGQMAKFIVASFQLLVYGP